MTVPTVKFTGYILRCPFSKLLLWDLCQFPGLLRRSSHNLKFGSGVTLDNWQLAIAPNCEHW